MFWNQQCECVSCTLYIRFIISEMRFCYELCVKLLVKVMWKDEKYPERFWESFKLCVHICVKHESVTALTEFAAMNQLIRSVSLY